MRRLSIALFLLAAIQAPGPARGAAPGGLPPDGNVRPLPTPVPVKSATMNRAIFMPSSPAATNSSAGVSRSTALPAHRRSYGPLTKKGAGQSGGAGGANPNAPRPNLPNYSHLPMHRRPAGW